VGASPSLWPIIVKQAGMPKGNDRHQLCSSASRKEATMHEGVKSGISFGSALAITISWSKWHSILWAMIHGVFSWFYVIYYALTR
jgi:hypothetical protein